MAKTLKDLRMEKGLTQDQLGKAIGGGGQLVSWWERGEGRPRPKFIPRLAEALGCTPEEARLAVEQSVEQTAADKHAAAK